MRNIAHAAPCAHGQYVPIDPLYLRDLQARTVFIQDLTTVETSVRTYVPRPIDQGNGIDADARQMLAQLRYPRDHVAALHSRLVLAMDGCDGWLSATDQKIIAIPSDQWPGALQQHMAPDGFAVTRAFWKGDLSAGEIAAIVGGPIQSIVRITRRFCALAEDARLAIRKGDRFAALPVPSIPVELPRSDNAPW